MEACLQPAKAKCRGRCNGTKPMRCLHDTVDVHWLDYWQGQAFTDQQLLHLLPGSECLAASSARSAIADLSINI